MKGLMLMHEGLSINPQAIERKLIQFIKAEFKKRGFKKAIFGLSGGVDSSTVAFLLTRALGAKNVTALFMPYKTTNKHDRIDFEKVTKILAIKSRLITITPTIDCYFKNFPTKDRIRRGNKMARERMSVLYDQSRLENALVVGSGNRTEILLGYATLYGDTACAVNPIGSLYKTQLRQLAHYIGVPGNIIEKMPTAGLWPSQTDEGELGLSYAAMDEILFLFVDKKYKIRQIVTRGFSKSSVEKILDRVKKFEYKRQLPAIAKI